MLTVELNLFQGLAIAALVYTLGSFLIRKVPLLGKYCIPAPVVGGLIYALLHLLLRNTGVLEVVFDSTLQDFFMTIFFTSVGFTASFRLLKRGGKQVFIFLGIAIVMVVLQNLLGVGLATAFDLDSRLGLCMGSIPMVGGHGTAGSMGDMLDKMGVVGAKTVAIASATYGLLSGSMLGGPLARRRIAQNNLHSTAADIESAGDLPEVEGVGVDTRHAALTSTQKFTAAAIFLGIASGAGTLISGFLDQFMTFPSYIGAMLAAAILRNIWDATGGYMPHEEISITGSVCLSLFLSFALMGLRLWELAELALPMIVILLAQTVLMAIYAYFVVFNLLGRDYESSVMTTAFCGFGMGATANAMANMQAVTDKYGPAPQAYFVVPLVGSLFIDFFNVSIITIFLNLLG
ncbi:sodium/glutamate symporter [Oscillibacter hominis]|uniref:Sodium/glutamate symporter n=1 Tax=Oscillibacter hominis TaxID=2763056 RepID=A0A7G9B4L2_9FIRM|nr:sodium/glutamate symporter [Oscillibacter hominis]QNL44493.1 sodium/glutamate symporter [Oscillibacter hominis]